MTALAHRGAIPGTSSLFAVDGANVVDSLVEIPLPGRTFVATELEAPGAQVSVTLPAFVAGPENRLVATAVDQILNAPVGDETSVSSSPAAWHYSPLVLWGASGSGKSHLAHGLVRWTKKQLGDDRAEYFTAADFRHEFREAIDNNQVDEFRERLRNLAVLAIDDVHRFPVDMYLQHELMGLVDELSDNRGFLIVTSNRPIGRLGNLWPALGSRLASGLPLRLDPPGPEARRRVVERTAALVGLPMPTESAAQIAASVQGTIHRVFSAVLELRHRGDCPSSESLEGWLQNHNGSAPTMVDVLQTTARYYSLSKKVVQSASRKKSVVQARAMAIYLARELCGLSYQAIADALGGRDHTTIMHSYRRIERDAARDLATQEALSDLRGLLGKS